MHRLAEAIERRYRNLPNHVHGDDPRMLESRILAGTRRGVSYEHALHQAALYLALAVSIDRAEENDPFSGDAA